MKKTSLIALFVIAFNCSFGQWSTGTGNIVNTNIGTVSILRNTGFNSGQVLVVNPKGGGGITVGEANTGAGGFTSLSIGISAASSGYSYFQSVKSGGSSYGDIIMNESGGNVGIGTNVTGSFKLAVQGKIGCRELKVTTAAWADYVFADNYILRDLASLEAFIKSKRHLPGMPSAEDIEKDGGFEVGATQVKLLEKIEELTLYLIELKKENDRLKIQFDNIEQRLENQHEDAN